MDEGTITIPAKAMEEKEMKWTTAGKERVGPHRAHRGLRYKFLCWLVETFLPGFHITENPPKGIKRTRKERAIV